MPLATRSEVPPPVPEKDLPDTRTEFVALKGQIADQQRILDDHDVRLVAQEHRLIDSLVNCFRALTQGGWSPAKRLAALVATLRILFLGRPTVVLSVGLGGLLALHANALLAEQNSKLDLQNHLAVVSSHVSEAQRVGQWVAILAQLLEDIDRAVRDKTAKEVELPFQNSTRVTLPSELLARAAVLSQQMKPYRWVETDRPIAEDAGEGSRGWLAWFSYFVPSPGWSLPGNTPVPHLTSDRWSPERGQLLVELHARRVDFGALSTTSITLERAYAPQAWLQSLMATQRMGPQLSRSISFEGAVLSDGDLSFSCFDGARMRGAKLHDLDAINSDFSSGDFREADLSDTELGGSSFRKANLDGANLHDADLRGSDLRGASMVGTDLTGAKLEAARLDGTDLRGARLDHADLSLACVDKDTRLPSGIVPPSARSPYCEQPFSVCGIRRE